MAGWFANFWGFDGNSYTNFGSLYSLCFAAHAEIPRPTDDESTVSLFVFLHLGPIGPLATPIVHHLGCQRVMINGGSSRPI